MMKNEIEMFQENIWNIFFHWVDSEVHLRKYFHGASSGRPPALCQIATNQQDKIPPQHQSYSPGVDQGMSGQAPTQQEMENIYNHAVDAG